MNRLFFISLIGIILFITSCSSKEDDPFKIDEEQWWEQYWMNECYGFKVRDTTGLKVIGMGVTKLESVATCLLGFRNEKLWIAKFDENTKELTKEWLINEKIDFAVTYHTGYGEYKTSELYDLTIDGLIESGNEMVASISGRVPPTNIVKSYLLFYNEKNHKIYTTAPIGGNIIPWYENTFLYYLDIEDETNQNEIYTCFKTNRETVFTGKTKYLYRTDYYYINYEKFISFERFNHGNCFLYADEVSHREKEATSIIITNVAKDNNARINYKFLTHNNNIVKIHFDIMEYSGEKYSRTYNVDLDTGEYEEIM